MNAAGHTLGTMRSSLQKFVPAVTLVTFQTVGTISLVLTGVIAVGSVIVSTSGKINALVV